MSASDADRASIGAQLGRVPRGLRGVVCRCECGLPAVVETQPRLADGTPFPTLYYLTCRCLNSALSTLESDGFMQAAQQRLTDDLGFADQYATAHEQYLRSRNAVDVVDEVENISAGGMPDRVKCLHALVAHSLAAGSGVNPVGDAALDRLAQLRIWPRSQPCVRLPPGTRGGIDMRRDAT